MPPVSQLVQSAFGLLLVLSSAWALKHLDPAGRPNLLAWRIQEQAAPNSAGQAQTLYARALRDDPANPYRWADLADSLAQAGRLAEARQAYTRATGLGPATPQIWVRAANFLFLQNEPTGALRAAAHALLLVPDYDAVLFANLSRMGPEPARILDEIGADRRATRAYLEHLIATNRTGPARDVWAAAWRHGFADDRLVSSYIDALLRAGLCGEAQADWSAYLGKRSGGYLSPDLLYNSNFESEPLGAAFDWRISPSDPVETVRDNSVSHDGQWSLRIRFRGGTNVSYANVIQTTCARPGSYRLRGWIKSDNLTTNEGPRLQVYDTQNSARLNVRTEPVLGTTNWTTIELQFEIGSGTRLIAVRVVRDPSQKFDNKIEGTLWLDQLDLIRQ